MYITLMCTNVMTSIMWLRAFERQITPAELLVKSATPLSSHLGRIKETAAGNDDVAEEARSTFIQPLTSGHFSGFQGRVSLRVVSGTQHAKRLLAVSYGGRSKDMLICLKLPGACCHIKTPLEFIAMVFDLSHLELLEPSQLQYWSPHHSNQSLCDGSVARLWMPPPHTDPCLRRSLQNPSNWKGWRKQRKRNCCFFSFQICEKSN